MFFRIALVARPGDLPDSTVWQTYNQLVAAGHAVELIDPDRHPGILLPDGTVDEPSLRRFSETFRPDLIATDASDADALVEECERRGAKGMDLPAKRFVVLGYIGEGNFGDELIFSLIAKHVQEAYPEGYVSLIGHDPSDSLQRHGVNSVDVSDKFEIDLMLNGAAALVFMAGVLFDIYFDTTAGRIDFMLEPEWEIPGQTACVQLAWMHGAPTVYLGIGAGPLSNPDAQAFLRATAAFGAVYCPRDPETRALLSEAGIPEESMHDTADMAFTLAGRAGDYLPDSADEAVGAQDATAAKRPLVVTLRDFRTMDELLAKNTAKALDAIVDEFGVTVEFLDLAPEDERIHAEVVSAMKRKDATVHTHATLSLDETVSRIASAEAVLATRLHGSIVANAFGIPSVGFNYNEKVESHYRLCDCEDLLLDLDASAQAIEDALRTCLANREDISRKISRLVSSNLEPAARRNFELLDRTVEQRPNRARLLKLYDKRASSSAARIRELEEELSAAKEEAQAVARELEELRSSTSWKLGRALTAPARKIIDARRDRGDNRQD